MGCALPPGCALPHNTLSETGNSNIIPSLALDGGSRLHGYHNSGRWRDPNYMGQFRHPVAVEWEEAFADHFVV